MEQLLHTKAGDVFHNRGQNRAKEKGQKRILTAAVKTEENDQGAVAVDGAERAVEEASFFAEPPLANGAVNHFPAPAEKTVHHQQ